MRDKAFMQQNEWQFMSAHNEKRRRIPDAPVKMRNMSTCPVDKFRVASTD